MIILRTFFLDWHGGMHGLLKLRMCKIMNKINIALSEVIPGMVTAEAVFSRDGALILERDISMTSHIIHLLNMWRIDSIWIESFDEKQILSCGDMPFLKKNLEDADTCFIEKYAVVCNKSKSLFTYTRKNQYLPYDIFRELADQDLYELLHEKRILAYLYRLKPLLDDVYFHAVNVGLIAGLIARWNDFPERMVHALILGGLLHDIGKVKIPKFILDNFGALDADEQTLFKLHPLYGYTMIKSVRHSMPELQRAVLEQHEYRDGSGYPMGIGEDKISDFAKILAIANGYDEMTSNFFYQKSMTPFQALENLQSQMFTKLDLKYCEVFIQNATSAFLNTTVMLNDKTQAEVLHFANFMSMKPTIKDARGNLLDLNKIEHLSIVEIIKFI